GGPASERPACTPARSSRRAPRPSPPRRRVSYRLGPQRALVLDHGREDFVEADFWLPGDRRPDLVERGNAARHVLEIIAVHLLIGDERDRRTRIGEFLDALGQREDRRLHRTP